MKTNKAESRRQFRKKRKEAGLCIECGKPAVKNRVRCRTCLERNAEKSAKIYRRKTGGGSIYKWREDL